MARSLQIQRVKKDQSGVASILVVLILMTVLGLITVAYSHLMNREVTQSLDRQLSAEAFYAAEAGVNDARDYLAAGGNDSSNCPTPSGLHSNIFVNNGNISGDNLSRYTCVLVDSHPKEVTYSLNAGQTKSFKVSLNQLDNLYFGWENSSYTDPGVSGPQPLASSLGKLPRDDQVPANGTGLLRVGIYPIPSSAKTSATNDVLNAFSRNYFMYPVGGGGNSPGSVNYLDNGLNGSFVGGSCNNSTHPGLPYGQSTPRYCNTVVNNLKNAANDFYVRITAYYAPLKISIQASDDHNKSLKIPDVQAIVDSTGSGSDVVRRVQARVPLNQKINNLFGLQSMETICKAFRAEVDSPNTYGEIKNDGDSIVQGLPGNTCMSPFNTGTIISGGIPPIENNPCPPPTIGTRPNCVLPPPSVNFTVNGQTGTVNLNVGDNPVLAWDSAGANGGTPCWGSWGGGNPPNTTFPPSGSQNYPFNSPIDDYWAVWCEGPGGTGQSNTVHIIVSNAPQPPNINFFRANGQSGSITINQGDSLTLSWSTSNINDCDITDVGHVSGGNAASGSSGVPSPSSGRTYYIDCGNPPIDQVIVNVNGGGGGGGGSGSCTAFSISGGGGTANINGNCTNVNDTQYKIHFSYRDSLGTDCGGEDIGPQNSSTFFYSTSFRFIDATGWVVGNNGSITSNSVPGSFTGGGALCG